MQFSEEKLKKMTKDELFTLVEALGLSCPKRTLKADIISLLLGDKEVEAKVAPKKRGRPAKSESKLEPKAESKLEAKLEPKTEAKSKSRAKAKSQLDFNIESIVDILSKPKEVQEVKVVKNTKETEDIKPVTENSKKEQFVRVVSSNLTLSFLRNVLKEEREIKESVLLKQQTKQPTKQPAPKVTPTQQVKGIVIKDAIIKDVIIEDEIIKDAIIKDVIIEDEIIKDAIIKEEDLTGELPTEYDETRVVIQARDPHWAWVYWELSSMERKSLEAKHGTFDVNGINLVLRVINESMGYTFDVSLPKNCNDWYLSLNDADCDYRVQLCLNIPSKGIEEITSSNSIHTPTDKVSERIAKWVPAIVEPQPVVAEAEGNVPAGECTISSVNDYAIENEVLEPISVKCDYIGGSSESIFNNGATTPELDSASSDFARPRSK